MNNRRKLAIIKGASAIVVVVLVVALAAIFIGKAIQNSSISSKLLGTTAKPAVDTVESRLRDQIALQNEIDEMLLAELDSGYYSPEEPLVVVNPYNISPLTALVLFQTAEPAQVSVHIPGRIPQTEVDFTFDGFLTDHILPIYGLYAGTNNQVALTVKYQNGTVAETIVPVTTEKLDTALNHLIVTTALKIPNQYYPGLNISYRPSNFNSTLAFDAEGIVRLQLKLAGTYNVLSHPELMDYNNHFLQVIEASEKQYIFVEISPLGRIYKAIEMNYGTPHHDMLSLDGGNRLLVLCDSMNDITIEDMIVELDMTTGNILHIMDLKEILQTSRNLPPEYSADEANDFDVVDKDFDPFHVNTIIAIDGSDDIIISPRNQNQIIRLTWPEGRIKWIAGDPTGITPMYEEFYLKPIGESFSYFYRQHAPEIITASDDDPDTIDLLLFDNGTTRNEYDDTISENDLYSRMAQYRIDEKEMTIELIREYGSEYGLGLYSKVRGDADELPNHNWLGVFDVSVGSTVIDNAPAYIEINQNNELVWMMQLLNLNDLGFEEYRVERQSLYNDAANDLGLDSEPIVILKD